MATSQAPAAPAHALVPGSTLSLLDEKIARSDDPSLIAALTHIRGQVIQQDQFVLDREHERDLRARTQRGQSAAREHEQYLQRSRVWSSLVFYGGVVAIGAAFVLGDQTLPGYFLIGAGVYGFVPGYVKLVVMSGRRRRQNA